MAFAARAAVPARQTRQGYPLAVAVNLADF
jgi:hypothetical protein